MNFEQPNISTQEGNEQIEKKSTIMEGLRRSSAKLKILAAMLLVGNTVANGEMQRNGTNIMNEASNTNTITTISEDERMR